jgi:hypothetical protein
MVLMAEGTEILSFHLHRYWQAALSPPSFPSRAGRRRGVLRAGARRTGCVRSRNTIGRPVHRSGTASSGSGMGHKYVSVCFRPPRRTPRNAPLNNLLRFLPGSGARGMSIALKAGSSVTALSACQRPSRRLTSHPARNLTGRTSQKLHNRVNSHFF